MLLSLFLILVGVVLLYCGGELLVDNSVGLARAFGVSTLVIGLTVVAFATSCPELAATIAAALQGSPDIAVGNVFGSNIANLGLILGLSSLVMPLSADRRFIRREGAFMVFATVAVFPFMVGGWLLERWEGAVLMALLGLFLHSLLREAEPPPLPDAGAESPPPLWRSSLGVAIGVALLVGGAKALVSGASDVARAAGISERVIGLTLVAVGTSLPELAASIAAARKGEGSLVLGNLVGSNVFNLLCILGLTALVSPIPVTPAAMGLDFWVMLGVSVLVLVFLASSRHLVRWEGAALLAVYGVYTVYLFV